MILVCMYRKERYICRNGKYTINIKMAPALTVEEIIRRTADGFERCEELEIIRDFVVENAEGILEDCR